jgi:hypothetical protein
MDFRCMHLFAHRPGWWWHRKSWMRWECELCNFRTRTYDSVDRMGGRPVHVNMSVAYPGYNTK